jgi:hypothetical protein
MTRPALELADVFRAAASGFRRWHHASFQQLKVMWMITHCRTAALGGHIDTCTGCGKDWGLSYNSCRNRHCPKCQAQARKRWLTARQRDLLPVPYFHVVFTLPHKLNTLIRANPVELYNLLFRSVADTLIEVAANPKRLGAQIGFFAILHTWTQTLVFHPHIHCVVPGGGLNSDHTQWRATSDKFLLPRRILRSVFRGKFLDGLKNLAASGQIRFPPKLQFLEDPKRFRAWIRGLHIHPWVVYTKPPFGGPTQVLRYLGRYTHRVAISNHRLVSFDGNQVQFRYIDRKAGHAQRILDLPVDEFIRRFLSHVLPKGFVRIRHFGFMANFRRKASLETCRQLLRWVGSLTDHSVASTEPNWRCPDCHAPMTVRERLTAVEIAFRPGLRLCAAFDTS